MSSEKKTKLIYSGELILFSIIFTVLAGLIIGGVINLSERYRWIFSIVTLLGGAWLVTDFVWASLSKKRKKKVSMIDKALVLPSGLYLLGFDVYSLIVGPTNVDETFFRLTTAIVFFYIAAVYMFEGVYHYFKPIPELLAAIEEDRKEAEEKAKKEPEAAKVAETEKEKQEDEGQRPE